MSRGRPVDVFDPRRSLVSSYADYIRSFLQIKDDRIDAKVKEELDSGLLWPESPETSLRSLATAATTACRFVGTAPGDS
jgi:hypothetical protein